MQPIKLVVFAAILGCSVPALAQWQWLDAQGRKVFSDRAPPSDIPAKSVLRQPGHASSNPVPVIAPSDTAGTEAATTTAKAKPADGQDKALEEQKRKLQDEEAAKEKVKQASLERQRKDNCARAQQSKTALSSGQLVANVNAQGERGFMDDATRSNELKRANDMIASDCGPMPVKQ